MNKDVAQKLASIKNRIADSTEFNFNIYNTEIIRDLLSLALTAFPDSYHEESESWCWCWNELSDDAQEYVQDIRCLINLFLKWKKD